MNKKPRTRVETSRTVVAKTFEGVLDILHDWYRNGYRLCSVKWDSDDCRYYVSGDRIEWEE